LGGILYAMPISVELSTLFRSGSWKRYWNKSSSQWCLSKQLLYQS